MKRSLVLTTVASMLMITSCKLSKKTIEPGITINLDTLEITDRKVDLSYRAEKTKFFDLIHTKLDVKFDWEKQYLYGKAWLDLKPYFFETNKLVLDAKGFDINEVALQVDGERKQLTYKYDGKQIKVELGNTYTRKDTIQLFVEYTAKPNELKAGGSQAISSDKGLYFINPLGNQNKPQQIWTQGETEASSCWFPTLDSPNQKTTQEISITVEDRFKTLSNGVLTLSLENGDGTRTDIWEQKKPHAPYLFMMAVGEFAKQSETLWDTLDISYYVEPEYEKDAKEIFNHTPEMIDFFSEKFGVVYPWDKYAQVIVRDYVSGAMENTSASIFGEFVQKTHREMIDGQNDDIVAHELSHHWFGDLVTSESWSNLPLNEAFATYSEYLWREHKYGRMDADHHLEGDVDAYLGEYKTGKVVDLIRFQYEDKEDMFDSHSYAKGGVILHMLRSYMGDEAFFEGLRNYLQSRAYKPAEAHHLRLAFEEVTGEDMNWFFNQWFYDNGHPILEIDYEWDANTKEQKVKVMQMQNTKEYPIYKLPIEIDLYVGGKVQKEKVVIDSVQKEFVFQLDQEPNLVNVDAQKMLLAEITDNMPLEWRLYQLNHAPLYRDKIEGLTAAMKYVKKDSAALEATFNAMNHPYDVIRHVAIEFDADAKLASIGGERLLKKLVEFVEKDQSPSVRSQAIFDLAEYYPKEVDQKVFKNQVEKDSSYLVIADALDALYIVDEKEGVKTARGLKSESSSKVKNRVMSILAEVGDKKDYDFFMTANLSMKGFSRMTYMTYFSQYLIKTDSRKLIQQSLPIFEDEAADDITWFRKYYAIIGMKNMKESLQEKNRKLNKEIAKLQEGNTGESASGYQAEIDQNQLVIDDIEQVFVRLRKSESNKKVKQFLD